MLRNFEFGWRSLGSLFVVSLLMLSAVAARAGDEATLVVDETPGSPAEWGFRPADSAVVHETPPAFVWRPQDRVLTYTVQVARSADFAEVAYEADGLHYNAHRPASTFDAGVWYWRFRYELPSGEQSQWSQPRGFTIADDAAALPLPTRDELLSRIPQGHPRLFMRPEQLPHLRELTQGRLSDLYQQLIARCERMLVESPDTSEPPRYPKGMKWKTPEWREIWWGNRDRTWAVLGNAASLGFAWRLTDDQRYGDEARRLLLAAAQWDPRGSTSFRYNDEAGMPYAYLFSRAYSFIHPLLSDEDRRQCISVMRVRGEEMYSVLRTKSHIWKPYNSHNNRAWHFLGEVAIAFHGEISQADEWLWYAMNIYSNVYPVWSGRDGGWHEGMAYYRSYVTRFLWWADIMDAALGISAFEKPFFAKAGDFAMYMMPPGTEAGGFGDQAEMLKGAASNAPMISTLAAQAGNPYWQWYVQANGGAVSSPDYIGFIRAAYPVVEPKAPSDLPASKLFRDVGVASLNTNLLDGSDNLQVLFKSSPFGTQSHGYDSQNNFIVYLFGKRLFIRSGFRDAYGSDHHKDWMWHTKSGNNITVNGQSQIKRSPDAVGQITAFHDDANFAYVNGEAAQAYAENVKRFSRAIFVAKPELVVIFDRLETAEPSTYEWHLHSINEMAISSQHDIRVTNAPAAARVDFLWPTDLEVSQSNVFDPPLNRNQELVQHHLTAQTPGKASDQVFITLLWPHRAGEQIAVDAVIEQTASGFRVVAQLALGNELELLLNPAADARAAVQAHLRDHAGEVIAAFDSAEVAK